MKILIDELASHNVEKLVICSLEQALYQAVVVIGGEEHLVWESQKRPVRSRNLMVMRESFEHLDIPQRVLRHESAYDEMVGLPSDTVSNRMEVPLDQNPYPETRY